MNTFQTTESGQGELKKNYAEEDPDVSDQLAARRKKLVQTMLGIDVDEDESED